MRLIDADELEIRVDKFEKMTGMKLDIVHDFVSSTPTAEPERRTGKAIVKSSGMMGYWACDQCNEPLHPKDNYCPNCGAYIKEV